MLKLSWGISVSSIFTNYNIISQETVNSFDLHGCETWSLMTIRHKFGGFAYFVNRKYNKSNKSKITLCVYETGSR